MVTQKSTERSRQQLGPWVTLTTMLVALGIGALLNADSLATTAAAEPPGWGRSLAIWATDVLLDVGDALAFDEPHDALEMVLDRTEDSSAPGDGNTELFVPTPERPAHLLAVGDSLIETIGAAIVNEAAETDVIDARFDVSYSSGLARPELYDWPRELAAALGARKTDIVVFMVGANDGQAIATASGFETFGTQAWGEEYRRRVDQVLDVLDQGATTSYWVGLPVAADVRLSERFAFMNEIYAAAAAAHPRVHFVDMFSVFATDDGDYAAYLPDATGRSVRVRDTDGVHFTPEGAALVADLVVASIADAWAITAP